MKTKNLFDPTPAQVKHRNRLWADALLKNKKKAIGEMYHDGGRCCLAVAQNVAIKCGVDIPNGYSEEGQMPHKLVAEFFGWSGCNPILLFPKNEDVSRESASDLNDVAHYSQNGSNGMTHKKIAECVLNTFVHPSKKKWSFKIQ